MILNSEVEDLRFCANQRGAGFPACQFAGLSSPASRRLESRPDWLTRMSAPRASRVAMPPANFEIEENA